jgi:hypothetical protein
MNRLPEPFTIILPDDWTPEQARAVQDCLDELLVQIQARYGTAVQQWLYGEDTDPDPDPDPPPDAVTQLDLFGTDFNDPLPF